MLRTINRLKDSLLMSDYSYFYSVLEQSVMNNNLFFPPQSSRKLMYSTSIVNTRLILQSLRSRKILNYFEKCEKGCWVIEGSYQCRQFSSQQQGQDQKIYQKVIEGLGLQSKWVLFTLVNCFVYISGCVPVCIFML